MKIKIFFILLIMAVSSLSVFAQEQKMTANEIVTFKQTVKDISKKTKTLSTDFIQYKHLGFLSKDIESSGKMIYAQPDLLQWQYKKPYNYSITFKKGKILIDDQGKKNSVDAGNSKIFDKLNKLIAGSVSGDLFDDKEFTIAYFKTKANFITRLTPKDANLKKYIKQIELTFDNNDHTVIQVKLLESSEDYTKIVLKNKVLNAKIDNSIFNN